MNVQCYAYNSARHVTKTVRQQHNISFSHSSHLKVFIVSLLLQHSMNSLNSFWPSGQRKLSRNRFNFSIRHLNYALASHVHGNSFIHLTVLFISYLAASNALKMAVTHLNVTQLYALSLLHCNVSEIPPYLLTCLSSFLVYRNKR